MLNSTQWEEKLGAINALDILYQNFAPFMSGIFTLKEMSSIINKLMND
jgi:hypothetical protein